jgi:hypothetical protein
MKKWISKILQAIAISAIMLCLALGMLVASVYAILFITGIITSGSNTWNNILNPTYCYNIAYYERKTGIYNNEILEIGNPIGEEKIKEFWKDNNIILSINQIKCK